MKALAKITDSQRTALAVLIDLGGWANYDQIQRHGANGAAAHALVKHGLAEKRMTLGRSGFEFSELRATGSEDHAQA